MTDTAQVHDMTWQEAKKAIESLFVDQELVAEIGSAKFSRKPMSAFDKKEWPHFEYEIMFKRLQSRRRGTLPFETVWSCGADRKEEMGPSCFSTPHPMPSKDKRPVGSKVFARCCSEALEAHESGFEYWASNLGFDSDSRTAEKIYNKCVEQYHQLEKIVDAATIRMFADLSNRL